MTTATETYRVQSIPVADITTGTNDRKEFAPAELQVLADSIAADGLGQPPTVRPRADGTYELVCGERRTRAMRDVLGWTSIPCIVRDLDDEAASALMLNENSDVLRVNLDPVAEARAFEDRITRLGMPVTRVAQMAGKSPATVRARLHLLTLTPDVQHLVSREHIPLGHAVMMAGLDANRQTLACRAYDAQRLDGPSFGALCDRLTLEQNSESMFDADSFMRADEYASTAKAATVRPDVNAELETLRARLVALESDRHASERDPAASRAGVRAPARHADPRARPLNAKASGTSLRVKAFDVERAEYLTRMYWDGCTMQATADASGVTRQRIFQLIERIDPDHSRRIARRAAMKERARQRQEAIPREPRALCEVCRRRETLPGVKSRTCGGECARIWRTLRRTIDQAAWRKHALDCAPDPVAWKARGDRTQRPGSAVTSALARMKELRA